MLSSVGCCCSWCGFEKPRPTHSWLNLWLSGGWDCGSFQIQCKTQGHGQLLHPSPIGRKAWLRNSNFDVWSPLSSARLAGGHCAEPAGDLRCWFFEATCVPAMPRSLGGPAVIGNNIVFATLDFWHAAKTKHIVAAISIIIITPIVLANSIWF